MRLTLWCYAKFTENIRGVSGLHTLVYVRRGMLVLIHGLTSRMAPIFLPCPCCLPDHSASWDMAVKHAN